MARVGKPHVPDEVMLEFFERLHALHGSAGQPSMRQLQRRTRSATRPNGIDPTTIHAAFSRPRLARWEVVQTIVRALDGDIDEFAELWHAARRAESRLRDADTPQVADASSASPQVFAIPRELPPDVPAFTGRTAALAAMDELLASSADQPTATVIAVLAGTAGVGKTALAVRWGHQVAERFPDGHLYVDLRGYDPEQPVTPTEVLARFLRTVGVAGVDVPYALAERAARYRSLLAGRRMMVILDNAGSVEQVRPLLPGAASCLVLVTSRDSLAGLVARHGARRLQLDLFTEAESVHLLRRLLGARADAEPAMVPALARMCTGLPLALRIAAEVATERPSASLAELVVEFSDEQARLDLFDAGADERTGVQAVFSWSYRRLSTEAARMFRLLGEHPGPDVDTPAIAALTGGELSQTGRVLDTLARAHLVQRTVTSRYAMHDLLRAYARRLGATQDSDGDHQAALTRLFDYYRSTAARAMDVAFPAESSSRPAIATVNAAAIAGEDPAAALRRLDGERTTLVASAIHAAHCGWPGHAIDLAGTLWRYLQNGAHHNDAAAVHTAALRASRELGDRAGEGTALTNLGTVHWRWGQYDQAADLYLEALAVFVETGDRRGQARVLDNLGAVDWQRGRYEKAAQSCEQAVAVFTEIDDRRGQARALDNLGAVYHRQGRYEVAAQKHHQALALLRQIGDRAGEARALDNLGAVDHRQGRYEVAAQKHHQALALLRQIGDRAGEAQALDNLGIVYHRQGRYGLAVDNLQRVLAIAADIGSRSREASACNGLGDTLRAVGQMPDARAQYSFALVTAESIGDRYEQARALAGLAHVQHAVGDVELARTHWRKALRIYTRIGVPEAADLRSMLVDIPSA